MPVKSKRYCKGCSSTKEIPPFSCSTYLHNVCSRPLWGKKNHYSENIFLNKQKNQWQFFLFLQIMAATMLKNFCFQISGKIDDGQPVCLCWWQAMLCVLKFSSHLLSSYSCARVMEVCIRRDHCGRDAWLLSVWPCLVMYPRVLHHYRI